MDTENMTLTAYRLTPAQKTMLRCLDGTWEDVRILGGEIATCKALAKKGLVSLRTSMEVQQSYYYGRTKTVYHVRLTGVGSDLLYTGALDQ